MRVQLEEQGTRFHPPGLSPDQDREEALMKEESVVDLGRVEDTVVSGFSSTNILPSYSRSRSTSYISNIQDHNRKQ